MAEIFLEIEAEYNLDNQSIIISEGTIAWGDGTNPVRGDISSAYILIQKGNEFPWKTVDVTTELKEETLTDLEILEGEVTEDDMYGVFLVMSTVSYTDPDYEYYSLGIPLYIHYSLKTDVSTFWTKYACANSLERKKGLYDICSWLETNLAGLEALASRNLKAKYLEVLELIQRKINLNKHYLN